MQSDKQFSIQNAQKVQNWFITSVVIASMKK